MASRAALISGLVAFSGIGAVLYAFSTNASSYGTFADARQAGGDRFYVKGYLDKPSVHTDMAKGGLITFNLTDIKGETQHIQYRGSKPDNLTEANEIVVIGGFHDSQFVANDMRVKCPSRYEDKKGGAS